jgi:hypothetical protein
MLLNAANGWRLAEADAMPAVHPLGAVLALGPAASRRPHRRVQRDFVVGALFGRKLSHRGLVEAPPLGALAGSITVAPSPALEKS